MRELQINDEGYGYDRFGLSKRSAALAYTGGWPIYRAYFRVESHGVEHVPKDGAAIIAANHSGMLPFDASMVWMDVVHGTGRVVRPLTDHLVAGLPFVATLLQRVGAVGGTAGNARALLENGEILLVFPEGVPGISKPKRDRYRVSTWRRGHAELALRYRAPIVPAAVIGAEEQFPFVHNSRRLGRIVGAPHVPITFFPVPVLPIPLPVKYRIYYGAPIALVGDADDPQAVQRAAAETQAAVQALIERGLRERQGVFR
jgi:1-acyl-sn-glycerol-3-phosphate acyltransferase